MRRFLTAMMLGLALGTLSMMAETVKVSGTVTSSDDGEALIGATVKVKSNPRQAVVTDFDGNYAIDVESLSLIHISEPTRPY